MKFYENLIRLRKQHGLSQEELGSMVNVTRQTISKWELGETTPELEKLRLLSDVFHVSVDELIGKEENYEKVIPVHRGSYYYEYQSKRMVRGIPLVHINIGFGIRKAKGIIAIGNIAKGFLAIGGLSMGVITFGALGLGLFSFGALTVGVLLAVGGLALGTIALGGLAVGLFAVGGCAIGMYAIGGAAFAAKIAAGGFASGHIAIGDEVIGSIQFTIDQGIKQFTASDVKHAILQEYPNTWDIIVSLFSIV